MNTLIITIDGPVASGKSTVAHLLAKKLGIKHLSSGLFYRSVAYIALQEHPSCNLHDEQLQRYLEPEHFMYQWTDTGQAYILYKHKNITPFLKTPAIDACAARLAERSCVRDFILLMQHTLAQTYSLIAEGRDLGSVVFPEATVKFFLTAELTVRAQRWQELQKNLGITLTVSQAIELISQRDTRDRQRVLAPLIIPKNAVIIDASDKSPEAVVEVMIRYVNEKRAKL